MEAYTPIEKRVEPKYSRPTSAKEEKITSNRL
jgi:hypothetical protein